MIPLDTVMTSSHRLSFNTNHVAMRSGLAAVLNAKFLPAAVSHVRRITYRNMGLWYTRVSCL